MYDSATIASRSMLALFTFLAFALPAVAATNANARLGESYGKLPLQFEANRGQTHKDVHFLSRGPGYSLYLTAGEAVLVLTEPNADAKRTARTKVQTNPVALRMRLVGAASKPQVTGLDELPGKGNYFIGRDRSKWRTNVPTYAKVHYREVYPGIDLVYYGNQRQLEYDFVVAPGANPKKIVLGFRGADKLEIDAEGNLVLHTAGRDIHQHKPVIYQEIDGVRREIAGSYVRKGANRVGFEVAAYDTRQPLVIDPVVLSYSTFLGGSSNGPTCGCGHDQASAVAADSDGNAYVTGKTDSLDFPITSGAFRTVRSFGKDVFVTKLNSIGSALVYSTYLGGNDFDAGNGIAVDTDGNAYVTGLTRSTNFPTTAGAFQPALGNGFGFVTKLDATGSTLVYSTYLGAGAQGAGIAVDPQGNAYVTGQTGSTTFPTTPGAFQPVFGGGPVDAFVMKLNPAGSGLVYSTYLGSSDIDFGSGIAVDTSGNAYVTGVANSTDFPTTPGAFQPASRGSNDAFVTKLNPDGSALVYSTYLGGNGGDSGAGIAVDADGNAYVTGGTTSTDFPTTLGAFQPVVTGGFGYAFVTKLNPAGSALVYSTYLGGSDVSGMGINNSGAGIAISAAGSTYVTGSTFSNNFPTTPDAVQPALAGNWDAFVTILNPTGSALVYSTYLGGSNGDSGTGIAVDAAGNAYVAGETGSGNFPTTPGAFQPFFRGGGGPFRSDGDAFVVKFAGIVLLVIDRDGIDDKKPPNFFSGLQVNDDVAAIGVRAQLRFFRDHVGQTITLRSGAAGDEGWFALKTIPQSWAQAGGAAGYVGNPAANPEDPAPQGTGPGLGAPDANGDPVSLLRNVPDVTPLRATALNNLIGREVCAVVYDKQVGINPYRRTGDLRGANLGTVAFQVVALALSGDAASSSLPNVQVRIRDARTVCRGPFALLTDAEAPAGAP